MEPTPSPSARYARALRVIAGGIALVAIVKHVTTDYPSAAIQRNLLVVHGIAAAVAIGVALLSSSRHSMTELRRLAFALGMAVVFVTVGATIVLPTEVWEQSLSLVAMMFVAAVFMPWSWRWQAAFVAIALAAATIALTLVIPRGALDGQTALQVLLTLYILAALTVVAAVLAEGSRQLIEAAEADRRAHDQQRFHQQRLDALGRFAGGIAHQFNNLLGGILTHAAVLRQDATQGHAAAELDEIAAAARRGRDLTEELLRFTRSDPVRVRPTDAAEALASVAGLARALLPEGAKIEVRAAPALPPIAGDLDHLVHACTQIVLNARDAMRGRPNPRLTLAAAEHTIDQRDPLWPDVAPPPPPGRYVQLSVTDTGRGMDAATVERVFDPLFTTKPMHEAKGLGLATVHRVIRDHGGAVRVESVPGRGTTVHLLLPVSDEPLPAAAPPPPPPRQRRPLSPPPAAPRSSSWTTSRSSAAA